MESSWQPTVAALAGALVLDLLGEPPNAFHPVAWLGKGTSWVLRAAPGRGRARQLLFGALLTAGVAAAAAAAGAALLAVLAPLPLGAVAAALLLKPSFALRGLGRAAGRVRDALAAGAIERARADLGGLCSRDAADLGEAELAAGAVESLAENASDSFVAPLFYYALLGLPGAIAYRAVNTLDAMIGYRGRYEYLGKAAARLDDVLNAIPARLTAGLLLAAGGLVRLDVRRGWRVLRRDGARTESPNAGRPMAAMAGLLGVALDKRGHYRLGDPVERLEAASIDAAWRVVVVAGGLAAVLALLVVGVRGG